MTKDNYKVLLEELVARKAQEEHVKDLDTAFMAVTNELLLRDYDLSVDELAAGDTDGSLDGQIDAMFVVVNSAIVSEVDDPIPVKGPLDIEILFVQSKNKGAFEANPLTIIRTTLTDLFDLNKEYSGYLPVYHERLQDLFAIARKAILASAGRQATVKVRVLYATKGSTDNIHKNVHDNAEALRAVIAERTAAQTVEIEFFGAKELMEESRRTPIKQRDFLASDVIASEAGDSFVCLVTIDSLVAFLSDDSGAIVRSMFDANVRDFEGTVDVNKAIKEKLTSIEEDGFWWFNNGVTIVAGDIDQKGKKLVLSNPLLVNGLQTSNVIHAFMRDNSIDAEVRKKRGKQVVLAKIIRPPNEEVRDAIITATNSQTNIPKPFLRGMDPVHRNIEDALKAVDLYYERRKNQYRNLGRPLSSIVSLREMGQALMSAILFRPADARGRPNSLLNAKEDYETLFSDAYDLKVFKNIILAKRLISSRMPMVFPAEGRSFRNDLVFHVLGYLSALKYKVPNQAAAGWKDYSVTVEEADGAIKIVGGQFKQDGGTDQVAKSKTFQDKIIKLARNAAVIEGVISEPLA